MHRAKAVIYDLFRSVRAKFFPSWPTCMRRSTQCPPPHLFLACSAPAQLQNKHVP